MKTTLRQIASTFQREDPEWTNRRKACRMRMQFNTGMKIDLGAELESEEPLIMAGRFWLACHESNVTSGCMIEK